MTGVVTAVTLQN